MIFPFVCVSCRTVQQTHLLKFAPNYSKLCVVASCTADIISYPFCDLLSFLFGNNEPHYTALHTSSPSARECGEQQTALFLCSAAVLICLSHTLSVIPFLPPSRVPCPFPPCFYTTVAASFPALRCAVVTCGCIYAVVNRCV